MKKSMKLLIACMLFSSVSLAQMKDSIRHAAVDKASSSTEYGRGISFGQKESTAASAIVTADDLSHKTSIDVSNNLFGLIPGLQVLQNAGNAWDDGATMYIRGLGTSSKKAPLILVDGFERPISGLTVQEIESVTVLKDAVSLSLYGIRGANGVIYIKTKRGTTTNPVIDFGYEFNFATPKRLPEFVDGYTYAQAINEGSKNDGLSPRYSQRELDAFKNQTYPDFYPNVDWVNEALRDHSYGDNVNFSIRGGGKVAQYFAQLNYLDDRGILQPVNDNDGYSTQFKFSKLNIRTNLDVKLGETTNLLLSLLGNFSEHNRPGKETKDIFNALYQVPSGTFPIKTKNNLWGGTSVYGNNPIAFISGSGYARSQTRTLFADMNLVQKLDFITPGLSAAVRIGLDNYASYWDSNTRTFAYESAIKNWDGGTDEYKKLAEETELKFGNSIGAVTRHFNFNAQVNYDKAWKRHKLNATLMYAMDKETNKGRNNSFAFMNIAAQAHYTYKDRYLLDMALSGSASSILDPDNRWGIFPSVGAGWVLSEEDFLKTDWLDLLKLRASYGIAGRADYNVNLFKDIYGGGLNYFYKDNPASISGLTEKQLRVNGLTYEKSHKLNVGIDFMAWNRLSLTIDGFYDHRTDILVSGSGAVSSVLGIAVPDINNGVVNSYGIEVSTRWTDRIGAVNYQLGGQFSFNRNKIENMNEVYRPHDYLKRTGRPLGQIFGYEVEGIYRDQNEIDNREVKQLLSEVRPGDLKFKDQNGDKKIDEYDMIALGYNDVCPEIYYSFDLGAEYKGVGFTAQFQGAANYSKVLDTRSVYRPLINNNTISRHYYENRWSESNPDGKYPRLTTQGSANNYNKNSLWVADASFLKLRTLEVYYQLPEKWLQDIRFVKQARFFARAHDLFCIDNIDIADPESIGATHPTMTQYTFGINLCF